MKKTEKGCAVLFGCLLLLAGIQTVAVAEESVVSVTMTEVEESVVSVTMTEVEESVVSVTMTEVEEPVVSVTVTETEEPAVRVTGTVTDIDHYGHAVLSTNSDEMESAGFHLGDIVTVTVEDFCEDMPYFNGYYIDKGEYVLKASQESGKVSVCINYGNFAEAAGVEAGDPVTVTLKEAGGALSIQELNNLVYSNDRADYDLDRVFCNFRPIVTGNIAEGKVYRSASPVNNYRGRAAYANELAELVRINAVMNLADSDETIQDHFKAEGFRSDYYKKLYKNGRVIPLGLPISFDTEAFGQGIARGLTFLSEQEPPYLIHCNEGMDRAGFASMVVEALMGASVEEIIADYMISYNNYYGVNPGTEKYDMIMEKNIRKMLPIISGIDQPEEVDLSARTQDYLIRHGMSQEAVTLLKQKLSGNE